VNLVGAFGGSKFNFPVVLISARKQEKIKEKKEFLHKMDLLLYCCNLKTIIN